MKVIVFALCVCCWYWFGFILLHTPTLVLYIFIRTNKPVFLKICKKSTFLHNWLKFSINKLKRCILLVKLIKFFWKFWIFIWFYWTKLLVFTRMWITAFEKSNTSVYLQITPFFLSLSVILHWKKLSLKLFYIIILEYNRKFNPVF